MKNEAERMRKWSMWCEAIAFLFWMVGLVLAGSKGNLIWPYWVHFINAIFFAIIAVGLKVTALYYKK